MIHCSTYYFVHVGGYNYPCEISSWSHFIYPETVSNVVSNVTQLRIVLCSALMIKTHYQNSLSKSLKHFSLRDVASSDDFWNEMEIALNPTTSKKRVGHTIKIMMDTWVKQQNYPVINVRKNHKNESIICVQHVNNSDSSPSEKWWIPLTYTTLSELNFNNTIPHVWLTPSKSCATLKPLRPNDWIIVNIQQVGKYNFHLFSIVIL